MNTTVIEVAGLLSVLSAAGVEKQLRRLSGVKAKPPSEVTPQLVERVHKFYEELGREDVRAVQE